MSNMLMPAQLWPSDESVRHNFGPPTKVSARERYYQNGNVRPFSENLKTPHTLEKMSTRDMVCEQSVKKTHFSLATVSCYVFTELLSLPTSALQAPYLAAHCFRTDVLFSNLMSQPHPGHEHSLLMFVSQKSLPFVNARFLDV